MFLKNFNLVLEKNSTKMMLLGVTNDILMTEDAGNISVLILCDLSAAFGTFDHAIMISRLKEWLGI